MSLLKSIIYLSLIIILIYFIKPSLFFTQNGSIRTFGIGYEADLENKKSLYNLQFFILISAFLIYNYFHQKKLV